MKYIWYSLQKSKYVSSIYVIIFSIIVILFVNFVGFKVIMSLVPYSKIMEKYLDFGQTPHQTHNNLHDKMSWVKGLTIYMNKNQEIQLMNCWIKLIVFYYDNIYTKNMRINGITSSRSLKK